MQSQNNLNLQQVTLDDMANRGPVSVPISQIASPSLQSNGVKQPQPLKSTYDEYLTGKISLYLFDEDKKKMITSKMENFGIDPKYLFNYFISEYKTSANLKNASAESVLDCLKRASDLELSIDSKLGFAYLLPFNNNNTGLVDLTFSVGYKGLIYLGLRNENVSKINVRVVYKNEIESGNFVVKYGKDEFINHTPTFKTNDEIALWYADVTFVDGTYKFEIMTKSEIDKIRELSKSKGNFWTIHYNSMAKAKVVRKLFSTLQTFNVVNKKLNILDDDVEKLDSEGFLTLDSETGEINTQDSFVKKIASVSEKI
jgi:phage RecT family recombinase